MNILIAADKFKGSLSTFEVAAALKKGLLRAIPTAKIKVFPLADGGDGFSRVMKHYMGTQTIRVTAADPLFRKIKSSYEWDAPRNTAIIEIAACNGIALLSQRERNPLHTSSYGTGLLIRHALRKGARKIILGLGGSATNDGGMGIASALGFQFLDSHQQPLVPAGASLMYIRSIIAPKKLPRVQLVVCGDVENPLYGKHGAAYTYAPQKGATPESVVLLDKGLRNLARLIKSQHQIDLQAIKGAGAAGGVPALLLPYFSCRILKGAAVLIRQSKLHKALKQCDWVITGEGKMDKQSFQGKLTGEIISLAQQHDKKVLVVCGSCDTTSPSVRSHTQHLPLLSLVKPAVSEEKAIRQARQLLADTVYRYFKLY